MNARQQQSPDERACRAPSLGRRIASLLWEYKFWWLVPLVMLVIFYLLLLFTMDLSGASPFRYILF